MFNGHNTGEITTTKQNASSNSLLRQRHPACGFHPGLQDHLACPPTVLTAGAEYWRSDVTDPMVT